MVDDVQFYIYTLLAVIVLSIIVGFLPKNITLCHWSP